MWNALEERDRLEKKYNDKWQAYKELERNFTMLQQNGDREWAVLEEKLWH